MAIVDAHSDLLMELTHAERQYGEANPMRSRWIPRLRRGGVGLQVCAVYVPPDTEPATRLPAVLRQIQVFHASVAANRDAVFGVYSRPDLDAVGGSRIGLLLGLEGASCLEADPDLVETLARLGVRVLSLTWNERNAFAAGCEHDDGLTALGRRLVERMLRLGMVVDLAHASARTVMGVLEAAPDVAPLVSHTACRGLHDHPRNLDDGQLAAIAARDGVVGLMPHPYALGPGASLGTFLDHVDHAVATMGIQHVGLGGDFLRQIARALGLSGTYDGVPVDAALDGLAGPEDYPALLTGLRERGYGGEELHALLRGNLLRLFGQTLPAVSESPRPG